MSKWRRTSVTIKTPCITQWRRLRSAPPVLLTIRRLFTYYAGWRAVALEIQSSIHHTRSSSPPNWWPRRFEPGRRCPVVEFAGLAKTECLTLVCSILLADTSALRIKTKGHRHSSTRRWYGNGVLGDCSPEVRVASTCPITPYAWMWQLGSERMVGDAEVGKVRLEIF